MDAANEFMMIYGVYLNEGSPVFKTKIYKKPDTNKQMIIRDYNKQLDFSTFLDDEQILLKTQKKFMVFSNDAEFINKIIFYKQNKEEFNMDERMSDSI
jgi:hypothetical protein